MQRYDCWPVYVFAVMAVTAAVSVLSCLCMTRYCNRLVRICCKGRVHFSVLGSGLHLVFKLKIGLQFLFLNALAVWLKDTGEELR